MATDNETTWVVSQQLTVVEAGNVREVTESTKQGVAEVVAIEDVYKLNDNYIKKTELASSGCSRLFSGFGSGAGSPRSGLKT